MSNDKKNSINSDNSLIRVQTTDWNKERLEQLKEEVSDYLNDVILNIEKYIDEKGYKKCQS